VRNHLVYILFVEREIQMLNRQTLKQRYEKEEKTRQFSNRLNEIQNSPFLNLTQSPIKKSEINAVKSALSDFDNTKEIQLNEFRRFMNVATQITQLQKSSKSLNDVKSQSSRVENILKSVSKEDDAPTVFKKMSDAFIELSRMITATAQISRSSAVSSVSNSVLSQDLSDKVNQILSKRR